jgi:hypothetical protein
VERALSTLARREETTISSWRLQRDEDDDDEVTVEQQERLRLLPRAKWPAKSPDAAIVRRGWLAVAEALAQLHSRGATHWLADLKSAFAVRNVQLTMSAAQSVAAFTEVGDEASGHVLAAALEVSLMAIAPVARAVPLLAQARLLWPSMADCSGPTAFPTSAGLNGFEIRRSGDNNKATRDSNKDAKGAHEDAKERTKGRDKTCHQCGVGGWSKAHVCADKDLVAFAKAHPRKGGF